MAQCSCTYTAFYVSRASIYLYIYRMVKVIRFVNFYHICQKFWKSHWQARFFSTRFVSIFYHLKAYIGIRLNVSSFSYEMPIVSSLITLDVQGCHLQEMTIWSRKLLPNVHSIRKNILPQSILSQLIIFVWMCSVINGVSFKYI